VDADHLPDVVQRQPACEHELQLQRDAHRPAVEHPLGDALADVQRPVVDLALQGARFEQRDRDGRIELLPDPRHGGEHGRRDLAHVLRHRLRVLDEVQLGAGVDAEILAADALGDVAQRQEAHALVAVGLRGDQVVATGRVDKAAVAVHRTLGQAGGARGVDEDRQVFGPARRHPRLQRVGVAGRMRAAQLAQRVQAHHARVLEIAQALHVEHDDLVQEGQAAAHRQHLVELLFVFDEQHPGVRIGAQVHHLDRRVGRIDAVRDAAGAEHREVGEHPFDDGVRQDRRAVVRLEAERDQAVADLADGLRRLGPAPAAPQAELLLAHEDGVAALGDGVEEHRRNRLAVDDDLARRLDVVEVPEIAHVGLVSARSSSFSSAARRARRLPSCRGRTP
jgi:hypothetical protein